MSSSRSKGNGWWSRFCYKLLLVTCKTIGLLPYWFLYLTLVPVIYFVVYRVARYRVGVVRDNLQRSFPEKSRKELRTIEHKFYHHLAELFVDTFDLASMSRKELSHRMEIEGLDDFLKQTEGQDWIAALTHYGEWEYFSAFSLHSSMHQLGVYRPLHNKAVDMYYHTIRSRFLTPVPMNNLLRTIVKLRSEGSNMVVGLIADQVPPPQDINHWYNFLGQPTPFFQGMERIALKFGMRVYFLNIEKIRPAHYRARFEMIYDGVEQCPEFVITQRYADALEQMIRHQPELWLWSHRRWKRNPQNCQLTGTTTDKTTNR